MTLSGALQVLFILELHLIVVVDMRRVSSKHRMNNSTKGSGNSIWRSDAVASANQYTLHDGDYDMRDTFTLSADDAMTVSDVTRSDYDVTRSGDSREEQRQLREELARWHIGTPVPWLVQSGVSIKFQTMVRNNIKCIL